MTRPRLFVLVTLTMLAFAGNSLLCRAALHGTAIDAATFTSVRLVSGAFALWLIVYLRGASRLQGSWASATALVVYAIAFSFAYVVLPAATGALLLFGAVQATMIGWGLSRGERLRPLQVLGLSLAVCGLIGLLLPGLSAPPTLPSLLMLTAGAAWGAYSLLGKGGRGDPLAATAGNFVRAAPVALVLSSVSFYTISADTAGILYALASGVITSGIGYAIWYTALPHLKATQAGIVQLSVPVIAALGGVLLLGETLTLRLALAAIAILGGIALVIVERRAPR